MEAVSVDAFRWLLHDQICIPDVKEIHLIDGTLTTVCSGENNTRTTELNDEEARQVIECVAQAVGFPLGESNPCIDAVLPWNGCFFSGLIPPAYERPIFVLSKRRTVTKMAFRVV